IVSSFKASQAWGCATLAALLALFLATAVPAPAADTQQNAAGMPMSVTKARRLCFDDALQLTARLVAREEVPVRPDAEGLRVAQTFFEDGDKVVAGQTLARLARTEGLPGPSTPLQ